MLLAAWASWAGSERTGLVIGGDLAGIDLPAILEPLLGDLAPAPAPRRPRRRMQRLDRPVVAWCTGPARSSRSSGRPSVCRRTPDSMPAVMGAILGGLFNSRLNMKLREEKGYTYGAGAGFDLRRHAGPFTARAAVNTDATAPALADLVAELRRMRESAPTEAELRAARDYLVGVFPLRFETPGVVAAVWDRHHGCPATAGAVPPAIEAVTAADVLAAAWTTWTSTGSASFVGDADIP
jgi:predicted Zn-dependent peptidase